ncbi:MAG: YkgJ family cysteine cluster protein [Luteibaculum sp.]
MKSQLKEEMLLAKQQEKELRLVLQRLAEKPDILSGEDQLKAAHEVEEEINCLDCANCCSTIPALLNEEDIDRLPAVLGITRSQFVQRYVDYDEDGDCILNRTPCHFLDEENKCKIYADRPQACREYPHLDDPQLIQYLPVLEENLKVCPMALRMIQKIDVLISGKASN